MRKSLVGLAFALAAIVAEPLVVRRVEPRAVRRVVRRAADNASPNERSNVFDLSHPRGDSIRDAVFAGWLFKWAFV